MYETSYNGVSYCFYDDHLTLNGNIIRYELMDNIQHRGGDSPAFVFDYSGKRFAMPYPSSELSQILPYMKAASKIYPKPDPVELVSLDDLPVDQPAVVAEPVNPDLPISESIPSGSVFQNPPASRSASAKAGKKKGCLILLAIFVALIIALVSCMSLIDDGSDESTVPEEPMVTEDLTEEPSEEPSTAADPLAELNTEERNAYGSALTYLSSQGLSRNGLIEQLKYEQYSADACEKAVSLIEENGEVDWNEECLESANNYLASTSMSRQELIDQLKYEGFTDDQINSIIDEAYQ